MITSQKTFSRVMVVVRVHGNKNRNSSLENLHNPISFSYFECFKKPLYCNDTPCRRKPLERITCHQTDGSIRGAAEACAATMVQSIWRAFECRKSLALKSLERDKSISPECSHPSVHTLIEMDSRRRDHNDRERMLSKESADDILSRNEMVVKFKPSSTPSIGFAEVKSVRNERKEAIKRGCKENYSIFDNKPLFLNHSHMIALLYLQEESSMRIKDRYTQFLCIGGDIQNRISLQKKFKCDPSYEFPLNSGSNDIRNIYQNVLRFEQQMNKFRRSSRKSITEEIAKSIRKTILHLIKLPKDALSFILSNKNISGKLIPIGPLYNV